MSFTARHPSSFSTAAPARRRWPHSLPAVAAAAATLAAVGGYVGVQLAPGGASSAPAATAQALDHQVLATSSVPGLVASRPPVVVRTADAWTGIRPPAVVAQPARQLRALGFTGGVVRQLRATGTGAGSAQWTSVAERYRTPAGARAEAAYLYGQLRASRHTTVRGFAVAGVPGAQGLSIAGRHGVRVAAVFAADHYVYLVSARISGANGQTARSEVSTAVGWLYLALHGCVAAVHDGRAGTPAITLSSANGRP